ncbi:MAG TPA: hypothetical protein DEB39_07775 [Planctomycetaceae bacterium]|nr:hypothetical protein [Planctomycetaceae bacterium]
MPGGGAETIGNRKPLTYPEADDSGYCRRETIPPGNNAAGNGIRAAGRNTQPASVDNFPESGGLPAKTGAKTSLTRRSRRCSTRS